MEYADILHRCFRCGYCKLPSDYTDLTCPSYLNYRFETYSPGGRLWLLRAWLTGEITATPRLAEIMFSCATCANCVEHCQFPKFKDDLLKALIAGREELVAEGLVPPTVRDYFKAMQVNGNPYKLPDSERGVWADGLGLELFSGQEYLFYVGDAGSLDERGRLMTRSVARLLKKLKISFGILGADEPAHGQEVRALGETGLFELLAKSCLAKFQELGVKKIIALSPHAYHTFRNDYPEFGGDIEVVHYSRILSAQARRIRFDPPDDMLTLAFHDPCYLGRHNQEYQAPRIFLSALPGARLVEMDRNRKNALCCGGGGGNFYTDLLGHGPDSPARARVREATATGVDVLVVACPQCAKMLEDAVKAENMENRLSVMDLSEIARSRGA
jgi:Fe-S oxidoreductase